MSTEGRQNTALAIQALVAAIGDIRETVQKARADGHIDKEEALEIFVELAKACIHEGLILALSIAQANAEEHY